MDTSEKLFLTLMIIIALCGFVLLYGLAIKDDKQFCIEQTTYTYNDCIVKLQG